MEAGHSKLKIVILSHAFNEILENSKGQIKSNKKILQFLTSFFKYFCMAEKLFPRLGAATRRDKTVK